MSLLTDLVDADDGKNVVSKKSLQQIKDLYAPKGAAGVIDFIASNLVEHDSVDDSTMFAAIPFGAI